MLQHSFVMPLIMKRPYIFNLKTNKQMISLLFFAKLHSTSNCIFDQDCKLSNLSDLNSSYCVNNKCTMIQRSGMYCSRPEECASFPYFGPIACSSQCKANTECFNFGIQKTFFCCKPIPKNGECVINRPGTLSGCSQSHTCEIHKGKAVCIEKKENSWMLGAFLSIFGNILINVGINYQKKSYSVSDMTIMGLSTNVLTMGSVIYIAGKAMSFSAYIFGSQSMIAGLSGTGLISNSVFAPLINNEKFTWKDGTAIFFVFVGTMIMMKNTNRSHIVYSLCELKKMYKTTGTLSWFIFVTLSIILFYSFIKFVEINSDWEILDENFSFLRSNVFFEEDGFICKYVMVFVYVLLSSFIASFTTLSIKSLAEIIDRILIGDNLFFSKLFNLFFISLILCTFLQIYWLNRALKHYDALLVIPIFHVSWTILSILTAGIYFQDFDHFSHYQLRNFIIGVLIIFFGSFFLAFRITNRSMVRSRVVEIPEETVRKTN